MKARFLASLIVLAIMALGGHLPQWRAAVWLNQLGLAAETSSANPVEVQFDHQAVSGSPNSGQELAFQGLIAATSDQQAAIEFLSRATQTPSVRPTWWVQLANLYVKSGQLDQAVQTLSRISNYDRVISAHCERAFTNNIKTEEAMYWCRLLQHLEPLSSKSACLVGQYLALMGQHSDAQLVFEQAASSSNVEEDCLYRYGLYRFSQKQYSEALALYDRAFEQKHLPTYLRAMGDLYTANQQPDMAIQKYQEAQAMALQGRDCADVLTGMAKVYYYFHKDFERASSLLYQAMQCGASLDVSAYWVLLWSERAQSHSQRAAQACEHITKALSGSTYLLEWRYECAAYLLEIEHLEEAQNVYQGILSDAPDDAVAAGALEKIGHSLGKTGKSNTK